MDYYLNEYSLRGQFKNTDDFFESLRSYTLPVLKKIRENEENVIWKRQEFWNSEICNGITINNIPGKKNERSGELALFKIELIRLAKEEPFMEDDGESNLQIKEYQFDEEYMCNFEKTNCFSKAIENEGRIISFKHPAYENSQLTVIVNYGEDEKTCIIDNIYQVSWWENEPKIETWRVCQKYVIEIRANEYDFHPPHFHVRYNEFSAVFKLSNGDLYTEGNNRWSPKMIRDVKDWFSKHKEELEKAWNNLHNNQ